MDLLSILVEEITALNITDKLKIAQYIYKRTGEIFEYDPNWIFSSKEEKDILRNKKVDIRNVTDFNITCFSWSRLYNELLHAFNIVSKIKYVYEDSDIPSHANVEVYINGRIFIADLTASYIDMVGIKCGLDTYYNCQLSKKSLDSNYEFSFVDEDIYKKDLNLENLIVSLKEKLEGIKRSCSDRSRYIYIVYKEIENLIKLVKVHTGYVIGCKYIQSLLKIFLKEDYLTSIIYFYDRPKGIFIAVHQVEVDGVMHYFSYESSSDGYVMREIDDKQVEVYYYLYSYKLSKDLKNNSLSNVYRLK